MPKKFLAPAALLASALLLVGCNTTIPGDSSSSSDSLRPTTSSNTGDNSSSSSSYDEDLVKDLLIANADLRLDISLPSYYEHDAITVYNTTMSSAPYSMAFELHSNGNLGFYSLASGDYVVAPSYRENGLRYNIIDVNYIGGLISYTIDGEYYLVDSYGNTLIHESYVGSYYSSQYLYDDDDFEVTIGDYYIYLTARSPFDSNEEIIFQYSITGDVTQVGSIPESIFDDDYDIGDLFDSERTDLSLYGHYGYSYAQSGNNYYFFDNNGEYLRNIYIPVSNFVMAGDYIYYQQSARLPDDAASYTYSDSSGTKYSLKDILINYMTGERYELDARFLVSSKIALFDTSLVYNYLLLTVKTIKADKTLGDTQKLFADAVLNVKGDSGAYNLSSLVRIGGNILDTATSILYDGELNYITSLKDMNPFFIDGVAAIFGRYNGYYGAVDYNGVVILPFEYTDVYESGLNGYALLKKDGVYHRFEAETGWLEETPYTSIDKVADHFLSSTVDGTTYVFNEQQDFEYFDSSVTFTYDSLLVGPVDFVIATEQTDDTTIRFTTYINGDMPFKGTIGTYPDNELPEGESALDAIPVGLNETKNWTFDNTTYISFSPEVDGWHSINTDFSIRGISYYSVDDYGDPDVQVGTLNNLDTVLGANFDDLVSTFFKAEADYIYIIRLSPDAMYSSPITIIKETGLNEEAPIDIEYDTTVSVSEATKNHYFEMVVPYDGNYTITLSAAGNAYLTSNGTLIDIVQLKAEEVLRFYVRSSSASTMDVTVTYDVESTPAGASHLKPLEIKLSEYTGPVEASMEVDVSLNVYISLTNDTEEVANYTWESTTSLTSHVAYKASDTATVEAVSESARTSSYPLTLPSGSTAYVIYRNNYASFSQNITLTPLAVDPSTTTTLTSFGQDVTNTITLSADVTKQAFELENTEYATKDVYLFPVDVPTHTMVKVNNQSASLENHPINLSDLGALSSQSSLSFEIENASVAPLVREVSFKIVITEGLFDFSITTSGTYPWSYDSETGVYTSSNQGVDNSSSSMVINIIGDNSLSTVTLSFDYMVSSENNYDELCWYKNYSSTPLASYSGTSMTSYSTATITGLVYGDYITITYSKDSSVDNGNDTAYIKNITIETETA